METLILGDLHGDFDALNAYLRQTPAQTLIICGDFGFWPALGMDVKAIKNKQLFRRVTIRFCDGNHEEHPLLRSLINPARPYASVEVAEGIFYQPRGSVWRSPKGERVLFAGGAYSVDNALREDGKDWFSELEILRRENLPEVLPEADVVVSHTAPSLFPVEKHYRDYGPGSDASDPSRHVLDEVLRVVRPRRWFFGHFHVAKKGETASCSWQCLPPSHDERPLSVKQSGIPNRVACEVL